jgi:hypothetical protein
LEEYKEYIDLSLEYKPKEKSGDEVWYETFEQVKIFIDENKKRPSPTSKNETEKKLGNWIGFQQQTYKKKINAMKDTAKYDLWTKFIQEYREYFKSNNEIWNENLRDLKTFLNENKRRPSDHKAGTEKTLGKWLSHQTTNYKNKEHGMKDQSKYNQWTDFLQEYQEYFSNDDASSADTQSISASESSAKSKPAQKKKSMKLSVCTDQSEQSVQSVPVESPKQRRQRTKTEISVLHQHYKTLKSENLNREFKENPDLWHKYHEISEENERSFPEDEIPRNRVIQELDKIKTKRTKRIVDMGCGKAQISQYFQQDPRFRFINYDHISSNDTVISCDIANTPLEDETVEICILSLAMWGSNCREYIQEANRILESNGQLYIIEPTKRWSEKDEHGNIIPGKEGSKLIALLEENGFRIARQSVEKFCLFVCNKV